MITLAQRDVEAPEVDVAAYIEIEAVLAAPVWLVDIIAVVFFYQGRGSVGVALHVFVVMVLCFLEAVGIYICISGCKFKELERFVAYSERGVPAVYVFHVVLGSESGSER